MKGSTRPRKYLVTQPAVIEGADYTIYDPMDDRRRFYQLLKP